MSSMRPVVNALWAILWSIHWVSAVGNALWSMHCGQCTVGNIVGNALWSMHCGQCTVANALNALWAIYCTHVVGPHTHRIPWHIATHGHVMYCIIVMHGQLILSSHRTMSSCHRVVVSCHHVIVSSHRVIVSSCDGILSSSLCRQLLMQRPQYTRFIQSILIHHLTPPDRPACARTSSQKSSTRGRPGHSADCDIQRYDCSVRRPRSPYLAFLLLPLHASHVIGDLSIPHGGSPVHANLVVGINVEVLPWDRRPISWNLSEAYK